MLIIAASLPAPCKPSTCNLQIEVNLCCNDDVFDELHRIRDDMQLLTRIVPIINVYDLALLCIVR